MDLRYSEEDEKFRAELRAWLNEAVTAHGKPPAKNDWPARVTAILDCCLARSSR